MGKEIDEMRFAKYVDKLFNCLMHSFIILFSLLLSKCKRFLNGMASKNMYDSSYMIGFVGKKLRLHIPYQYCTLITDKHDCFFFF